jgi:TPR repeat protein
MKLRWKTVVISCVALIFGSAIIWLVRAELTAWQLAKDATACRVRAEQGDAESQFRLGSMYYHGKGVPKDYVEAVHWYRESAEHGNAKAQYNLSYMYREGEGIPQDYAEAIRWCRRAAEEGDAKAQDGLGFMYYRGEGVAQDYGEAVRWYRKAADQGYAEAQYALGYMYYEGKEVPQDDSEAVAWCRKAADQGYAKAQSALGYMYFQGRGVQRNYAEAARSYRKAAKQGDEYSRRALAAMKIGFPTPIKVALSIAFLGSIFLLISSRGNIRNRQQGRVALAGLLGLLWVGSNVYGYSHFGILQALSAVNAFYFGKSLLSGICISMFLSIVWPQGFKTVLTICAMLFIGFNVYAMTHYDLRRLPACPRVFILPMGY